MCPHANGDSLPAADPSQMVQVDLSNGKTNGVNGHANGTNGAPSVKDLHEQQKRNPYAARASDLLSNVSNFSIIESTLRGV